MSEYVPKAGDHVRVTLEGRVTTASSWFFEVECSDGRFNRFSEKADITVEKIEPPVEVFKPGEVIRHKGSGVVLALAEVGFLNIDHKRFYRYVDAGHPEHFTSEHYERVVLP